MSQGDNTDSGNNEPDLQVTQDTESSNPSDHAFCLKMNLPKQPMMGIMNQFTNKRRDVLKQIQLRETSPEGMLYKQKADQYRKMDDRSKEDHRRRETEYYKAYQLIEKESSTKQKFSYSLFEPFTNRGKNPYIKFTHLKSKTQQPNSNYPQSYLLIRFNKRYFLEDLKMTRNHLLSIPLFFFSTWDTNFLVMSKQIHKFALEPPQRGLYTIYLRSIDLISITFDVQYGDKRIYRFRYSPFQFRSTGFFKQEYQLVGYNQCVSMIPQINLKHVLSDQDFYSSPRCFMFDDLTDNLIFQKILQRSNIFYAAYSISRGLLISSNTEAEQFSKKYLWQLYFSTTRLKKFIFTWAFRPFKRVAPRSQSVNREIQLETKEIIFHIPFYVQIRESKDEYPYRIRIQYHDPNKCMPVMVKQEVINRVKQWYWTYKQQQASSSRDYNKDKNINQQERILQLQKRDRQRMREAEADKSKEKPDRQDTQLETHFGNRDKFDRFLLGMLVIVSTVIDRNYFTMLDERVPRTLEDTKVAILDTPQILYVNKKHEHMKHYHWLEIHMENKILPYLFRQERQKTNLRNGDMRYKCGQWRIFKLFKCKREWNLKTQKPGNQSKISQVQTFSDVFKEYIDTLLKHFSMRYIYKDIINFVAGISKNCFNGWQQNNSFELNIKNQAVFRSIVAGILGIHYFTPFSNFKQKQQKKSQKPNQEKQQQQQQRVTEEQKLKKQDRLVQQFYKMVILKILTKGDPGFMYEDKLLAQVTFRILQFKTCWITRMKDGLIMLRVFDDRIDFQRQYEKVDTLKFNLKNKSQPFEEQQLKEKLQKLSAEIKATVLA